MEKAVTTAAETVEQSLYEIAARSIHAR